MKTSFVLLALAGAAVVAAEVQPYHRCGGRSHTGETVCVAGWSCRRWDEWYSQCMPENYGKPEQGSDSACSTTLEAVAAASAEPVADGSSSKPCRGRGRKGKGTKTNGPTDSASSTAYSTSTETAPVTVTSTFPPTTPTTTAYDTASETTSTSAASTPATTSAPASSTLTSSYAAEPTATAASSGSKCKRADPGRVYRRRTPMPIHPAH